MLLFIFIALLFLCSPPLRLLLYSCWLAGKTRKCLSIKLNHPLSCDVMMCAVGFSHAQAFRSVRLAFDFSFHNVYPCERKFHSLFPSINCIAVNICHCLLRHPSLISVFHPAFPRRAVQNEWKFLLTLSVTFSQTFSKWWNLVLINCSEHQTEKLFLPPTLVLLLARRICWKNFRLTMRELQFCIPKPSLWSKKRLQFGELRGKLFGKQKKLNEKRSLKMHQMVAKVTSVQDASECEDGIWNGRREAGNEMKVRVPRRTSREWLSLI